jgi:hypothetical protein
MTTQPDPNFDSTNESDDDPATENTVDDQAGDERDLDLDDDADTAGPPPGR